MARDAAILCLVAALAGPAAAAPDWDPLYWNPVPLDGDVVLPMPCGAAMAFRVETPVQPNWLDDESLLLGNSDIAETVVGGLTRGGAGERFYLIGKYEVTRDQYAAVMSDTCPAPDDDGAVPIDAIPFLDAQSFAARYTRWLYADAPDALDAALGPGAYLRLPSASRARLSREEVATQRSYDTLIESINRSAL